MTITMTITATTLMVMKKCGDYHGECIADDDNDNFDDNNNDNDVE